VPDGETVRLVGVEAGHGLRARLAAMGLVPGAKLRMMRNSGHGPAVVEVKDTRLALGRGMTVHLRVE
jgi:Fe2+ transport system protein FeoA